MDPPHPLSSTHRHTHTQLRRVPAPRLLLMQRCIHTTISYVLYAHARAATACSCCSCTRASSSSPFTSRSATPRPSRCPMNAARIIWLQHVLLHGYSTYYYMDTAPIITYGYSTLLYGYSTCQYDMDTARIMTYRYSTYYYTDTAIHIVMLASCWRRR
jgi:hypothetical protein